MEMARATPRRSPPISVIPAAAIATSVPVPMAMPTSAWASAGASLMPSPTIATSWRDPFPACSRSCNRFTSAALSAGSTSASTRSIPTCPAMASAVCRLSPVIITTSRPSLRRSAIASRDSGFTVSATATRPADTGDLLSCAARATIIAVLPPACSRAMPCCSASIAMPSFWMKRGLPTRTGRSSTVARMPKPLTALKAWGSTTRSPRAAPASTIARPSGCSDPRSALAARCRTSSSVQPGAGMMSVSAGWPRVIVPVLSSTTRRTRPARSRVSLFLKRIPFSAPLVVPTMIAVGVARPSAQGHAITRTATALIIAPVQSARPNAIHATSVTSAIRITAGTK